MALAVPSSQDGNSVEGIGLMTLPDECMSYIASFLRPADVATFSKTCWRLNNVLSLDNLLWRSAVQGEFSRFDVSYHDLSTAALTLLTAEDDQEEQYASCAYYQFYLSMLPY